MVKKTFGDRLKELRTEQGLTIDELVDGLNKKFPDLRLCKSNVSRYENNINKPKQFDVVECLSYFFGVTPGYLMGRSDNRYAVPFKKIPVIENLNPDLPLQLQDKFSIPEYVDANSSIDYAIIALEPMPTARIAAGDMVYLDIHASLKSGDITLVASDGGPARLIRYYEAEGNVLLKSEGAGQDIVILRKNVKNLRTFGKVVSFKSEVK